MNDTRRKLFLSIVILGFFLILNIYFSQNLSPVFFNLVNNDKKAVINFLKNIRLSPEFEKQIQYFEDIYGSSIKDDVLEEELHRESEIKKLEQILKKNPQSRDVLYRLYQLHLEKGDNKIAEKYFRLAKKVDPNIK